MTPKRVDEDARRQQILNAAIRVFARKGFAASRVEDVAAEAGIGKGSVYLAFDSREAILDAVFEELAAADAEIVRIARTLDRPAAERLEWLVHAVIGAAAGDPDLARLFLDLWTVGRGGEPGHPLNMSRVYERYRETVTVLLEEAAAEGAVRAGTGAAEAAVIVGAIEGCLLQWVVDPRVPLRELAGSIFAVCLDGLRPREGA
ncbi:TetR/AcrR family transcriptional regulator [Spirillospora sp. NPDC029432]|uniref:TetR/AcrR family transcriptional regulator n=1 Tax=Spirillospora sp. NPDC029432 TaxID=3154599 RepID=UPI0034566DC9